MLGGKLLLPTLHAKKLIVQSSFPSMLYGVGYPASVVALELIPVLMQIGGEWLVAGGESAEVTGDEGMFSLGTSQLVFLAGNVLQVRPLLS
jgi:hypothetical protein